MFKALVKVADNFKQVIERARKVSANKLNHAVAGIRKDAQASIHNARGASDPGTPPNSRRGKIRNAITFAKATPDNLVAVVGPRASRVDQAARAHEIGGEYKGQDYPKRSFMWPAAEGRLDQFGGSFAGSLGE